MRIEDLAHRFPEQVRRRGLAYQKAGGVDIKHASAAMIRAIAIGTAAYEVRIAVEAGMLVLACSCPYFDSTGPCKHLWATALAADEQELLAPVPSWTKMRLEESRSDEQRISPGELRGADDRPARPPAGHHGADRRGDDVRGQLADDRSGPPSPPSAPPELDWKTLFVGEETRYRASRTQSVPPIPNELLYVVEIDKTRNTGELTITLRTRMPKKGGGFAKDKPASVAVRAFENVPDERDRRALPLLQAAAAMGNRNSYDYGYGYGERCFPLEAQIPTALAGELMPLLSSTGRLYVRAGAGMALVPAAYDGDPPWDFVLALRRRPDGSGSEISGLLRRGSDDVDLSAPLVVTMSGWLVFDKSVGRVRHFGAFGILGSLRAQPAVTLPTSEEGPFLESLYGLSALPKLDLPEALALQEIAGAPQPQLKIGAPDPRSWSARASDRPVAELSFRYGGVPVAFTDPRDAVARVDERRLFRRDRSAETAAATKVLEAGFGRAPGQPGAPPDSGRYDIAPAKLPAAVRLLVGAGWRVEGEGKLYRQAGRFNLSVTSGLDWFDLQAKVDFDDVSATLPALLRALRRGDNMILLGDGTFGMLPEEWIKRYRMLGDMGTIDGERLRFRPAQVGMLDALLAAEPQVSVDAVFAKARKELNRFAGIKPEKAPTRFSGRLRPYQEVGLGWLSFLRRFGFGGCLADDMGLGKTIQVLAMLAGRPRESPRASIVVVPKSLVWNWQQEAARFAPDLRLVAHVGPDRAADARALRRTLENADVLVTTYGLLRKDVAFLRELEMDYVILDEAQAIKNSDSESAKAARLLRGQHRLALSGTPIENHLGELWSLIEFLNPGMLGTASAFANTAGAKRPDPQTLALLSRALRPFILRRTKEEVAPELPKKHEETILCEMEPAQRALYDELRAHYRGSLLGKIAAEGIGKAKIQVLEALLRLRQAACHPGLIDKKRRAESSGKMDVLLARLDEVRREGHKALVFSQFTSFLALVRARLDSGGVPYEYLDGQTRDRQARVTRFQTDDACPLFLISLKAGGLGLNLTAADYVFILDPWWNPAVEAQAVDRAHRIGQKKRVFVYRLLCRDTVEEKVAALQQKKRDLTASIINADAGLLRQLDRETLELLLS
jgi:SNF2-related domain/Helicase conserved C-terminal domain/SWIM zinc finger